MADNEEANAINTGEVDFEVALRVRYHNSWVSENFEWETPPSCTCGWVARTFDEQALFVRNAVIEGNKYAVHAYLITAEGEMLSNRGTPFKYCPLCGDEIIVSKKQGT